MQFFNFGNHETFHFFKWIVESGQVQPEKLILEAFTKAEIDEEHFSDEDICIVLRDKLAARLQELLGELAPDADPAVAPEIGTVYDSAESLWLPLLAHAIGAIDCHAVATALLLQAGKWNPSKEPPELS